MTGAEAYQVAKVIAKADGGCPYCVKILIGQAQRAFPDFDWQRLVWLADPTVLQFPDEEALLQKSYRERVRESLEHLKSEREGSSIADGASEKLSS